MMSHEHTQRELALGPLRIVAQTRNRTSRRLLRAERRSVVRRAVAAVEAAVTMPLLVLLVFGSIEIANGIFLAQTLSFAGYEGAREAARPGATAAQVNDRVAQVMHARGIQNYSLSITPDLTPSIARGTMVTVRVGAAMSALSTHATGLTGDRMAFQEVSMVKH